MRKTSFVAAACAIALTAGCSDGAAPRRQAGPTPSPSPSSPAAPAVDYAAWDAGRSEPLADPLYPKVGNPGIDVLHYGLELAWTPKTKILTGTATLRIRPTADAAQLSLDFLPYQIDGVTLDGADVTGTVAGQKLTVPAEVVADRPVTLEVRYHGTPKTVAMPSERGDFDEGLGLRATKDGSLWTMQEPYGAFTWYPANDHPSDEALYDIAVTVPKGWSAIASGTPAGVEGTTFRYTSADPVASYLTTLAVGVYAKVTAKGPRGIPLTYWYRAKKDKKLLPVMKKSPSYLTWLEKKLGPYPFPTAGVVIVESESAMETQQMVTFGGKNDPEFTPLIMVHEYAHQWFGNTVTPKTWVDLWLNEGWAQYLQYLYDIEDRDIPESALESFLRQRDAELRKEVGPPGKPKPGRFAESNVYVCTAAMLHELHDALGDKKFFALARAWAQENRNTQQDRASFIAFVNKQTGKNFTKLINTWLDSKKTPR